MNKVLTALSKAGATIKKVSDAVIHKVLPVVITAAEKTEPLADVALAACGEAAIVPEYNATVEACYKVEQAAVLLPSGMTSEQKFAAVMTAMQTDLLPTLKSVYGDAADKKLQEFVQAVVTTVNTFPAAAPATA